MMFFKTLLSFSLLFAAPVFAEEEASALRDLQIGMAGLQEAATNPALLAQLMQDLQVRGALQCLCKIQLLYLLFCLFVNIWLRVVGPRILK